MTNNITDTHSQGEVTIVSRSHGFLIKLGNRLLPNLKVGLEPFGDLFNCETACFAIPLRLSGGLAHEH